MDGIAIGLITMITAGVTTFLIIFLGKSFIDAYKTGVVIKKLKKDISFQRFLIELIDKLNECKVEKSISFGLGRNIVYKDWYAFRGLCSGMKLVSGNHDNKEKLKEYIYTRSKDYNGYIFPIDNDDILRVRIEFLRVILNEELYNKYSSQVKADKIETTGKG